MQVFYKMNGFDLNFLDIPYATPLIPLYPSIELPVITAKLIMQDS